MEPSIFEEQVLSFTDEIRKILDGCLLGELCFEQDAYLPAEYRIAFKGKKHLHVASVDVPVAELHVQYALTVNSTGNHLAVRNSSFKLVYSRGKAQSPVLRYEFDRETRNKPSSHLHFHSESVPISLLLASAGEYKQAFEQQNIHFPLGNARFRLCLEDVVEFLIGELHFTAQPGWEQAIARTRADYLRKQTETVIRKNLDLAREIMAEEAE